MKIKFFLLLGSLVLALLLPSSGQPSLPSFSSPVNISQSPDWFSHTPAIAVDEQTGTIYVVWEEEIPSGSQIYFAKSDDGGETFSEPKPISEAVPAKNPAIAVGPQGDVLVVWEAGPERSREIYFRQSINGGEDFLAVVNVSNTPREDSLAPAIAIDPTVTGDSAGTIYIAWQENISSDNPEIFLSSAPLKESQEPLKFIKPINISNNATRSLSPEIAVGEALEGRPGNVFVTWVDEQRGRMTIFFRQSAAFSSPMEIPTDLEGERIYRNSNPVIVAGKLGHIFLAWEAIVSGNLEILMTRAEDAGIDLHMPTFTPPYNLSNTKGSSQVPAMAIDEQENQFLVWQETRDRYPPKPEIVFHHSLIPYIPPLEVFDSDDRSSLTPAIALDIPQPGEVHVYVVWEEEDEEQPGRQRRSEIFFAKAVITLQK